MPTFIRARGAAARASLIIGFAVTIVVVAHPSAQTTKRAKAAQAVEAPIIDREAFFGDPELSGAQISPDGTFIAFLKPYNGTRNIWIKRTNEPFDSARPITADTKRPIREYFWSRDSKYVLYVQDEGGDENFNVFAVSPSEPAAQGREVPEARNITEAKGVRAFIYALPKSDPDALYVGLNDRDPAWHDLYKVKISTGERMLVRKNTDRFVDWTFDRSDKLRLATRVSDAGATEVLRLNDNGLEKIYECNVFETCAAVRFHKDGARVYMLTNEGQNVDLTRLTLLDVTTGKEELVESDPMNRVDMSTALFSDVTDDLVGTVYIDDRARINWRDKQREADYNLLKSKIPNREIDFGSSTTDEQMFIILMNSDVEPGETYLFNRTTKALTLQYRIREKLPREHLASMKAIRYKSSDGLEIPAYLTFPKGATTRNLPVVVVPHGGPWSRDDWGYHSTAQFLSNRGYAVLQPNYRGSTGYGKKFLDAGNLQWGEKMQDDVTWGVKHLVAQGIADPKRVGILGGSYGGYATLAGLAFTPEVYAAGVSIVGPSNLITLLNSIPPYWEAGRALFDKRMGDPTDREGKERLERQSPLNSADKIRRPLLVIQGANDPRVKKAESDQIVVALRDRKFPVEYIVAPDEGHGFARPVNNMAMFAAAEKFLAKHLNGRYQETMTPEVETRLREITVDPATVEKPGAVTLTSAAPKPVADLTPGSASYKTKIEMGANTVELTVASEIEEEGETWVVTETAESEMGNISDRTVLSKGSLVMVKRSIAQGPIAIDLEVKDGKAVGEMKMGDQPKPFSVDIGGDLFADGGGAHQVLATLPLAEGYTTTYRNFDVQMQKMKPMQLKVVGTESVTVPAGTFDAYKIEIASPEDGGRTTVWVAKDSRKAVKSIAISPRMNGATITSELQK